MYIDRWDEFSFRAKELFVAKPDQVRYTFKYRHVDQCLVLKVTDDVVCLKYKTDKQADVNKMDKLNAWFYENCTNAAPSMADPVGEEEKPRQSTGKGKKGRKGK